MKRKTLFIAVVVMLVAGLMVGVMGNDLSLLAQDDEFTYAGSVDAPEFPEDTEWINVSAPLTMEELEGKIVLLDFWTYGCINCIHVIPDLERLEEEFADELVVVGVHSAKFENEGQTDNIREIVQRYEVVHPVVNDADFTIWRTYGVRAWPTLVLIDPTGKVVGGNAGEGVYEVFQPIISTMVEEYSAAGLIDPTPLAKLAPEVEERQPTSLQYPGKVLADVETGRLFISDSSHHRLVVSDLANPSDVQIIGTGEIGFDDGPFAEATFHSPQGLALDGDLLYVTDTENHAIRVVDLAEETVTTLVGTGVQAADYPPISGTAPDVALSSPWDVTLHDGVLYIAMAGPHQLWRVDLESGLTEPHAGNSREDIVDGPLDEALLAQPSGITTDGELLYFADAEVSAIRSASIDPDGEVKTIVGTGLFEFGDVDGVGDEVLLQHALGVTIGPDGLLYVADTYNHKIKVIDPDTRESRTFAGTGEAGLVDGSLGEAQFYEPGGINYADGKLYVADTNNHVVRVIDLEAETVSTVDFGEATALLMPEETSSSEGDLGEVTINSDPFSLGSNVVELSEQTVAAGEGEIVLDIQMPEGYKLNELAPFTANNTANSAINLPEGSASYQELVPTLPVRLPVTFTEGQDMLTSDLSIYWCEAINETLCFVERVTITVPVTVAADAESSELVLPYVLVPPVQ